MLDLSFTNESLCEEYRSLEAQLVFGRGHQFSIDFQTCAMKKLLQRFVAASEADPTVDPVSDTGKTI